jgi:hypothetical protein
MRLKIETSDVRFRAGGSAQHKKRKGEDAVTPDGRPIWVVRLTAIDDQRSTSETIWVEVAGDEPRLTIDDLVQVHCLVYAPWVNRDGKIVRTFRAEQITPADPSARKAAA